MNPLILGQTNPSENIEMQQENCDNESSMHSAELQGLIYKTVPFKDLPDKEAFDLVDKLCQPEERFYKAFYRYWRDVLHQPEEMALASTRDEVNQYIDLLKNSHKTDPYFHSIGFLIEEKYVPVGIYGFRPLSEHSLGHKFLEILERHPELKEKYNGNLGIAHAFSMLEGHRNRLMLRYAFALIGLEAMEKNIEHIFFFLSDYRLERVYKRFGLEFPENLKFSDTQHSLGSYSINDEQKKAIIETARQLNLH